MATINVLAGDIQKGEWVFLVPAGMMKVPVGTQYFFGIHVEQVELVNEDKVKKLAGTAGWGFAGAVLLGPIGAIGGMLIGGNKKEVVFAGQFKDGRKFLAKTDGKTWSKIITATFK